jgi:hypothetical protein
MHTRAGGRKIFITTVKKGGEFDTNMLLGAEIPLESMRLLSSKV